MLNLSHTCISNKGKEGFMLNPSHRLIKFGKNQLRLSEHKANLNLRKSDQRGTLNLVAAIMAP